MATERISKGDRLIVFIQGRPELSGHEVVVTKANKFGIEFESELLNSQKLYWIPRVDGWYTKVPR